MSERKQWVDLLRGIAMMAILLFHTEAYYVGSEIISYSLYVTDALMLFFFLSGYLFYTSNSFNIRHKINSILRGLVVPYFLFSTLLYLPKVLVHGESFQGFEMFRTIVLGEASWFIAALVVAECLFALIILATQHIPWLTVLLCTIGYLSSSLLTRFASSYPWCVDIAFIPIIKIMLGYFYHRYESYLERMMKPLIVVVALGGGVALKTLIWKRDIVLMICPVCIDSYALLFLITLFICVLLVLIGKRVASCRWMEWVGRHSIVYYFFCGGVPLLVSAFFRHIGMEYDGQYWRVIMVYMLVFAITSCIVWVIYKYLPFMVGKRR